MPRQPRRPDRARPCWVYRRQQRQAPRRHRSGDYAGRGIDEQCQQLDQAEVDLREYENQQEAEATLATGAVDAYAGNDFVTVEPPDEFALAAELPRTRNGIGHRKGAAALDAALRATLRTIIADGTYLAILQRYGAADNAHGCAMSGLCHARS